MVRSANKFYIFICTGYTIGGVLFHWLLHNFKHDWYYMEAYRTNRYPNPSVGDGETGELIYFVLYYIMWPRVIRRNNRVSQCEKTLQR